MARKKGGLHLHLKKGALHEDLGVPQGEKLSSEKIQSALHSPDPKIRKRANFARNAKKWHHTGRRSR